jgi:hypothetical protein
MSPSATHRPGPLRRRIVALAAAATVGVVGATSVGLPAHAADSPRPLPVGTWSAQELMLYCAFQGGSFSGELGDAYMCVLPNGHVIFCAYQTGWCVLLRTAPPKPSKPGTGVVAPRTSVVLTRGG